MIKVSQEETRALSRKAHQGKKENVVEHCKWASHIKAAHVLIVPQGRASDIVCGAPDRPTFEQTRWMRPECSNGTRDRGIKQYLLLGSKRTVNKALGRPLGLEVIKLTARFSIRLQQTSDRTWWSPHPKLKKKSQLTIGYSGRAV
jgi:hypothetical protein